MLLRGEWREFIMKSTMSDWVLRRVVSREEVSYHIRLIVNFELDQ